MRLFLEHSKARSHGILRLGLHRMSCATIESRPPAKSRRWRIQFSLRTLLLFPVFIGFAWTLTATWGVRSSMIERLEKLKNWQPNSRIDPTGTLCFESGNRRFRGVTKAVAPFVIDIEWKSEPETFSERHLWLFGYQKRLDNERPVDTWGWLMCE